MVVNGEIVTVGAPAYALAPPPQLSIAIASVSSRNVVDIAPGTNGASVLVTNRVPVVTAVLSWPASATNSVLYFLNDLLPQDALLKGWPDLGWQTVPVTPVVINGRNVITNTGLGWSGFYELH